MIKYYCDKCGKEIDILKEDYRATFSITDTVNKMKAEFSLCAECKNKIVNYIDRHSKNFKHNMLDTDGW